MEASWRIHGVTPHPAYLGTGDTTHTLGWGLNGAKGVKEKCGRLGDNKAVQRRVIWQIE